MENKETLEDFIKSIFPSPSGAKIRGIELGAEWQAKRMHSEEDVIDLIQFLSMNLEFNGYTSISKETAKYFFNQYKKENL